MQNRETTGYVTQSEGKNNGVPSQTATTVRIDRILSPLENQPTDSFRDQARDRHVHEAPDFGFRGLHDAVRIGFSNWYQQRSLHTEIVPLSSA